MAEDKEECETCNLSVGMGMVLNICKDIKEVDEKLDCDTLHRQLMVGEVSAHEVLEKIKAEMGGMEELGQIEELEDLMKGKLKVDPELSPFGLVGKDNKDKAPCISLFAKMEMDKKTDEWIENREKFLENIGDKNSEVAKGTEELIENLKKSKELINNLPTCEEK